MRGQLTLIRALVPHLLRTLPRTPMVLGSALAVVVCSLPLAVSTHPAPGDAALLLRVAAVLCTVPAAFALDDPAARTTAVLPVSLAARRVLRLTLTLAPLAVAWTVCGFLLRPALRPDERVAWSVPGLALEAAALGAATVMVAALGLRLSAAGRGSLLAAPSSVLLPLVLTLTPARSVLFAAPYAEGWDSSRRGWAVALVTTAGVTAVLLREGRPTTRRSSTRHTRPGSPQPAPSGESREAIHP
ncbi:hypothetical protein [Streptomyces botrytidirepellens]|uniref:ABC transporter n=1 Tax=Streptomyces botrytidirepellens TaxID=2486417 RepID=A0A3M8VKS5_9ACTN|nr:hypothetical protein [Streptomyces botrytidirepellens]RNG18170.1 hypothetical protein EEJ42_27645 [Streptomyces botrytidirepellens]